MLLMNDDEQLTKIQDRSDMESHDEHKGLYRLERRT